MLWRQTLILALDTILVYGGDFFLPKFFRETAMCLSMVLVK